MLPSNVSFKGQYRPFRDGERLTLGEAASTLEEGNADAIGLDLRRGDEVILVQFSLLRWDGSTLNPELEEVIERLDSYAEFSLHGNGLNILCLGSKPEGFRHFGTIPDGVRIEVHDSDCSIPLSGKPFRVFKPLSGLQSEIDWVCQRYLEPCCPLTGVDGKLEAIVPELLGFSEHQETFDKRWRNALRCIRKEGSPIPCPPEFVASLQIMAHLFGFKLEW